jgi:hypothetical protein
MTADLKVGLLSTLYATWLHNSLAIALVVMVLACAGLLVLKPKRRFVFFLLGFLLLLLEFEYRKHFGKALEEQTINSVILQGDHLRTRSLMEDFFQKLIPFGLWLGGWGLVFLGILA